jgi:DNA-binding response OmpR family regulator
MMKNSLALPPLSATEGSLPPDRESPPLPGILLVASIAERSLLLQSTLLDPRWTLLVAWDSAQALDLITGKDVSLVVLDLALRDGDGKWLLQRLCEDPLTAPLPILVIGDLESVSRDECITLGLEHYFDYLPDPQMLCAVASTELRRAVEATTPARSDPATGCPDDEALRDYFEHLRAHAERSGEPFAVALLSLENHTRHSGNAAASAAPLTGGWSLEGAASTISGSLRRSDLVARWSACELIVFFLNTSERGAEVALHYAWRRLQDLAPEDGGDEPSPVPFAARIAEVEPGMTLDDVVIRCREASAAPTAESIRMSDPQDASATPDRIVLAEDDRIFADVIRHRLEREGLEVLHFDNGADLIREARGVGAALFLLDMALPEMDGLEVLQRLRTIPSLAQIPVIVLTSVANEREMVRAFQLGADDYVAKPFAPSELLARIQRLLAARTTLP